VGSSEKSKDGIFHSALFSLIALPKSVCVAPIEAITENPGERRSFVSVFFVSYVRAHVMTTRSFTKTTGQRLQAK